MTLQIEKGIRRNCIEFGFIYRNEVTKNIRRTLGKILNKNFKDELVFKGSRVTNMAISFKILKVMFGQIELILRTIVKANWKLIELEILISKSMVAV